MPGQGYHLAVYRLAMKKLGREVTEEGIVGTLLLDALNSISGSRRCSHFTGGAGCLIPSYAELSSMTKIQAWDSKYIMSYLVDPEINMALMEQANIHLPEDEYKGGIRIHLIADKEYDQYVQNQIFDFTNQSEDLVKVNRTGDVIDGNTFRSGIYAAYPMIDQFAMSAAGITPSYVENVKKILRSTLPESAADFICKYLNFNPSKHWVDTEYFKFMDFSQMFVKAVDRSAEYYLKKQ